MKRDSSCLSMVFLLLFFQVSGQQLQYQRVEKQRVLVLTDITNEPDDQESLVRFLVYANEYDVEGMIATTSVHLKNSARKDKILELVSAYGEVQPNLDKHAKGFPTAGYLRSVTKAHLPLYGMTGVGSDKNSEGSDLIIRSVDKVDARPLWISVWGGANCLAQALWKVRETRSSEELKKFVSKIKVYSISDQDDAGRWIRTNYPGIFYIVTPSAEHWLEYYKATWTGISGDRHYKNAPMYKFGMVDNPWLEEHIINGHGPLGKLYPRLTYIMEGDTPAFLGLINNGLGSAISPAYGGWSGRYDLFQSYAEAGKIWTNTIYSVDEVIVDGKTYASDQATIWRWREAFQNDFAARMDWCVASRFSQANHNPVVGVNQNESKDVIEVKGKPGQKLKLSAKASYDPDKNGLTYFWFVYKEAGRYTGDFTLPPDQSTAQEIDFIIPALKAGESLHIILQVKDDGVPALVSYRRVIVTQ
jgi:hypothetical protein